MPTLMRIPTIPPNIRVLGKKRPNLGASSSSNYFGHAPVETHAAMCLAHGVNGSMKSDTVVTFNKMMQGVRVDMR